jgi:homocysteine S-methyltransferase
MGPRGDAYDPAQALAEEEAVRFHSWQAEQLALAGVDFLQAATLPALSEALGMARAMAQTGLHFSVSFVIRGEGRLLDGTPLAQAMEEVDRKTLPGTWFMGANCVHPTVLARALDSQPAGIRDRLLALQANTSMKSPEELDGSAETETEEPAEFARAMIGIWQGFGVRILGGCCGTDGGHIRALAGLMRARLDEQVSGA